MTTIAGFLLVLTGFFAVVDWVAVARQHKRLEYLAKPATMVALVGVALAITPVDATQRGWFVAALVFCLAGDVFLMLEGRFVPGLASFLVGHLAYVAGFWLGPVGGNGPASFALALLAPAAAAALFGPRILAGAKRHDRRLIGPVANYLVVITAMVGSAVLTRNPVAIAGAGLFFGSDAMIGFRNFVAERPWHNLAIITTYHLGQVLLVLSLIST